MLTHQDRVVAERDELRDRREKLAAFIGSNPIFATIPEDERVRLRKQLEVMSQYEQILNERIANFPE